MAFKNFFNKSEDQFDKIKFKVKDKLGLFDPVIIYPYLGYGTTQKAVILGRILEKKEIIHGVKEKEESIWTNLLKIWNRYESDEIPKVEITGRLYGHIARGMSDEEGYFKLEFSNLSAEQLSNGWHDVVLEILNMPFDIEYEKYAKGEILINDQASGLGIISDVDDTIIKSNAMNPIKKMSTMVMHNANSRVPFEGVSKLYHQLIKGYKNPLFFVSGSSYNLFDLLVSFCKKQDIPKAPFFLRDLGLNASQWIKQNTKPYKIDNMETILQTYNRLQFICIGDSGQEDPEIYREVHQKYPGRIKAIYIRHVHNDKRLKELKNISEGMDIPFLILKNSKEAIAHSKEMGSIE